MTGGMEVTTEVEGVRTGAEVGAIQGDTSKALGRTNQFNVLTLAIPATILNALDLQTIAIFVMSRTTPRKIATNSNRLSVYLSTVCPRCQWNKYRTCKTLYKHE